MSLPRLGIVVPVLNQAAFLRTCLESLVRQGYPRLSIVVVDGGSTDGSIEIVRELGDAIDAHIIGQDSGQSDAINLGIAELEADYVGWVNGDDYLLPNCLNTLAAAVGNGPRPDIVSSDAIHVDARDRILKFVRVSPQTLWAARLGVFCFTQPALFYSKSCWERVGGVDKSYHLAMDVDLWYRMFEAMPCVRHVGRFFGAFRIHEGTKTSAARSEYAGGNLESSETRATRARHGMQVSRARLRMHRAMVKAWRAARGDYLVAGWLTYRYRGHSVGSFLKVYAGTSRWP